MTLIHSLRSAPTLPLLSIGFLLLALTVPFSAARGQEEGGVDVKAVIQELRAARAAGNDGQLYQKLEGLRGIDDPALAEAIIQTCLGGHHYSLERGAGALLMRMTSPKSVERIYRHLGKNPSYKTRIVLTAVAYQHAKNANPRDPEALQALLGRLYDPDRRVIFAALGWLRKLQDTSVVTGIIKRYKQEARRPGTRLYNDLNLTLRTLTGEDIEHPDDWNNYWKAHKAGVASRSAPKDSGEKGTRRVSRQFFSISLDSDKLIFIIDVSGSMEKKDVPLEKPEKDEPRSRRTGVKQREEKKDVDPEKLPVTRQRLYRVKAELTRTIKSLPQNVFFTIVAFNHGIHFLDPKNPQLIQATPGNISRAVNWVGKLKAEGETWTDTVFERLFEKIPDFDTVIFLSDGMPYRNESLDKAQVRQDIKTMNRFQKCRIHTIGFYQSGKNLRTFLEQIARDNDGKAVLLE